MPANGSLQNVMMNYGNLKNKLLKKKGTDNEKGKQTCNIWENKYCKIKRMVVLYLSSSKKLLLSFNNVTIINIMIYFLPPPFLSPF